MKYLRCIAGAHDAGGVWVRIVEFIYLAAAIYVAGRKEVQRPVYEAECQAAAGKGRAAVPGFGAVTISASIKVWRKIEASGILEISLGQKRLV